MIVLLPTRSPRKYRGKYPDRVNSWSYSRSPSQMIVAKHLDMTRPVHIELNDGRRFVIDMKILNRDGVKLNVPFLDCFDRTRGIRGDEMIELSQDRYDAMLAEIRAERGHG